MEPNKYLIEIQKTVIDWLKFAEAKNAALLVGNLTVIFGATKVAAFSSSETYSLIWWYYISIVAFCSLSAMCCFLSIIPQIKIPYFYKIDTSRTSGNLVFYGTIATHTPDSYCLEIQNTIGNELSSLDKLLAGQIVINSQIACRKYRFFKVAAWLTLSAFLTPLVGGVLVISCKE